MKTTRCWILDSGCWIRLYLAGVILFAVAGTAHGQTLGEVLRAAQNRQQLAIDQANVTSSLYSTIGGTYSGAIPSQITWTVLSGTCSSDGQVNGLTVEQQIALLRQAWGGDYAIFDALGGPITVENFPRALQLLAGLLKQNTGIAWPVAYYSLDTIDMGPATATPPIPFYAATITPFGWSDPVSGGYWGSVGTQGGGAAIGVSSIVWAGSANPPPSYSWEAETIFLNQASTFGSPSYSGTFNVFTTSSHSINAVSGLTASGSCVDGTNAFYDPGAYPWTSMPLSVGSGSTPISSLTEANDYRTLVLSGTWVTLVAGLTYVPDFSQHSKQTYQTAMGECNPGAGNMPSFNCTFNANFGTEFASTATPPPEPMPALRIVPNFERNRLDVRLASDPANDCVLYWALTNDPTQSLACRHILSVRGYGNYDAVYSGRPEDREPEYVWPSGTTPYYYGTNVASERWTSFSGSSPGSYLSEWWQPVLKQLKTATYGINIIEHQDSGGVPAKSTYEIDFYRTDQIGAKDTTTGTYSFSGSAIESWTVSNPTQDDNQGGQVEIATPNAAYYLTGSSGTTPGTQTWILTGTDTATNTEFLNKNWAQTSDTFALTSGATVGTIKVVDTTKVDGQPLPTVTTEYYDMPTHPLTIQEDGGADGTRTTTYIYDWETDPFSGDLYLDHLTGISGSSAINQYTATYDDNELLTDYTNGPNEVQIAYSGSDGTVTRTELFNSGTVRVVTTTYSGGLTSGSSSIGGVSGAAPAMTLFYSGSDPVYPWGLQAVRGFDGTLTTYAYGSASGTFTGTVDTGREGTAGSGTVAAGTQTVTTVNPAGRVISYTVTDIESGAQLDSGTATAFQNSVFPSYFTRPLGATEGFIYDNEGRILSHTDVMGKTTSYTLDAIGRPITITGSSAAGTVSGSIAYNPGYLGYSMTMTAGSDTRTQSGSTSPFGANQMQIITGPQSGTFTRTETADTITTQTSNGTTAQTTTGTVQKSNLATNIGGNATQPWNISYAAGGSGGMVETTTHGTDSSLTTTTTSDAAGEVIEIDSPNPGGGSASTTTYGYTNGQLTSMTDPNGNTTHYTYQPDGSPKETSSGSRSITIQRTVSNSSGIEWTATDALSETLWKKSYAPSTLATTVTPYGLSAQAVTTTPTMSSGVMGAGLSGPFTTGTSTWNGSLFQYSGTSMGVAVSGSAATNLFGELTSEVMNMGANTANAVTKNYTTLGLPSSISGPTFSGSFAQSFDPTSGFTQTYTGNGHSQSVGVSPSGDWQGSNGYGAPNFNVTAPSFGSTITQTGTTGAGTMTFTKSLAGTLLSRTFPDASSESFTYDANGAVTSWKNARGTTLDFNPNQFGQPTTFGTFASIGYDDAGRVGTVTDASGSGTFTYVQDKPANVTYTSGVLAGQFVNRHYDNNGRVTQVDLPGPGLTGTVSIYYGYDSTTGQMSTVTTASGVSGTWSNYDSVSGRAKNFTLGSLSVSRTFDGLGRIASETSTAGGISYGYGGYTYDGDGHCTSRTAPEGMWTYGYDSNGYLNSASGGLGTLTYSFDEAGRPSSATGDYYATTRTNAGTVKVFGSANPSATVTINGTSVTVNGTTGYYGASYTPARNTWQTYTVTGSLAAMGTSAPALATDTRNVYIPPATESLNYDGDGNRSADAKWSYTWDDMNRLAKVTLSGTAAASPPVGQATEIDYVYDLQGRRVQKTVTISGTGGVSETRVTTTLWDNMRQVMDVEKNSTGTILAQRYYTWGPDVSGSLDGKAGIGGLIEIREIEGPAVTVSVPFYDGIGNIVGYVDEATGQTVARFTYGPFAELLSATGLRASSLPFGFQTKIRDSETGNLYFVKRYYNPSTLMWVSRDPIREEGGVNLYAYCNNDPVGSYDAIGLAWTWFGNGDEIYAADSGGMFSSGYKNVTKIGLRVVGPEQEWMGAGGRITREREYSVVFTHNGYDYKMSYGAFEDALRSIPGDLSDRLSKTTDASERQRMLYDFFLTPPAAGGGGAKTAAVIDTAYSAFVSLTSFGEINADTSRGGGPVAVAAGIDWRGASYQSIAQYSPLTNQIAGLTGNALGAYAGTKSGFTLGADDGIAPGTIIEVPNFVAKKPLVTVLGSMDDVAPFANRSGFNVLDMSNIPKVEWSRYNAEWLNQALVRGDDVWLVTDPVKRSVELTLKYGTDQGSAYISLELPMLEEYSGVNALKNFGVKP